MGGIVKYIVKMCSGAVTHVLSFVKIGLGSEKIMEDVLVCVCIYTVYMLFVTLAFWGYLRI
jgi:hypothetical protein